MEKQVQPPTPVSCSGSPYAELYLVVTKGWPLELDLATDWRPLCIRPRPTEESSPFSNSWPSRLPG